MANTAQPPIKQEIILTYRHEVEALINQHQGIVVYSKDDVIIASDISDSFYNELLKRPYIQIMNTLPLKRYTGQQTPQQLNNITVSPNQSGNTKVNPPVDPTKLNNGGIGA